MQPDFWSDKRPAGVPNDIDLGAYKSVIEVFERSCKKFADRPAFSNLGVTLSYAELERHSAAFAAWLQQRQAEGNDPSDATLEVIAAQQASRSHQRVTLAG